MRAAGRWAIVLVALLILACGGKDAPQVPASASPRGDPSAPASTESFTIRPSPGDTSRAAILRDVRILPPSEADGWDRIIFEFEGSLPPGEIEYTDETVACASGERVRMLSTAVLVVRFSPAVAHDEAGKSTLKALDLQGTGHAILRARQTCDAEGEVAWAVAVNGRQPFKVTVLTNPTRLAIDVQQ